MDVFPDFGCFRKKGSKRCIFIQKKMLTDKNVKAFLCITDSVKAKAFYQDMLRLKLSGEDSYGLEFELHSTTLRLSLIPSHQPATYTVLGWQVNDIYAEMKELGAQGIVFEQYNLTDQDKHGVWNAPGGTKVAWFKDPFGNLLSIDQKMSRNDQ
jgi:hypothetical protein